MDKPNPLNLSRESCTYTGCYCEENVWKVCKYLEDSNKELLDCCSVVFISNQSRLDYHVILVYKSDSQALVYDLDTTLTFPCDFEEYSRLAFRSEEFMVSKYHRLFRVIPGHLYLSTFASDRSHMKNEDGTWKAEPPPYPCISTNESSMNLDDFISMNKTGWHGDVLTLPELLDRFLEGT